MKKMMTLLLVLFLVAQLCPAAFATESAAVEIHTAEDLQRMADDPEGSYVLMADLDMAGVDWTPVDMIGGSFDGNGHTILNLTISTVGNTMDTSYDGNRKTYDTCFAGFFGVLRDASVKNLKLVNVRGEVASDQPCFLGSIAGAMYDSQVADCSVSGILELQAHDRMFGLGGIAGYGSGRMERCVADMTLICIDTGVETLDEQFLGGAYATGFIDVVDCNVTIDGYVSEYGYVHNGGLIGMVMQYPLGDGRKGYLTGNSVTGKIAFFECNQSRRAYCDAYVGETLAANYSRKNNQSNFKRDETWKYDVILRPEICDDPVYDETMVAPGCDSFGYTTYICQGCGYSHTDHYTLPQHTVTVWNVTKEPTVEETGISTGLCDVCGMEFTREEPKLEPTQPETQPPQTTFPTVETTAPMEQKSQTKPHPALLYIPAAVLLLIAALLLRPRKKKGKFQK